MGYQQDLQSNRRAYEALNRGEGGNVRQDTAPVNPVWMDGDYTESGVVPEARFQRNLAAGIPPDTKWGAGSALKQEARSQPDVEIPLHGRESDPEPKIYRLTSPAGHREPGEVPPTHYPDPPAPDADGQAQQGDLLEALIKRMEAGTRRYPQEIPQESDALW